MSDVEHTRGDTFTVTGEIGRSHASYTGWTGRSQIRDEKTDELLAELDFTWLDAATGKFVVQTNDTDWPVGSVVLFDVQVTSPSGVIASSKVVRITVIRDVTKDG